MLELDQVLLDLILGPSVIDDRGYRHSQLALPARIECARFKKMDRERDL